MVGEDHGVATLLKEKDSEILELRARLDDKDRMLDALRSAARSRDTADRDPRSSLPIKQVENGPLSPVSARTSQLNLADSLTQSNIALNSSQLSSPKGDKRRKSVDEMSKVLDEMINDRVERGALVRGSHGSVRIPSRRETFTAEPMPGLQLLKTSLVTPGEFAQGEAI